ncbi:MAG: hypothetical protein ACOYYS_03700 [Chloroflexota bacterium]
MSRWIRFFIVLGIGMVAALFYTWVVNPVQYTDTAPNTLRQDYKTDYVLMVAEVYHADGNLQDVMRQLALLGDKPPAKIVDEAIRYARGDANGSQALYPLEDLALMQALYDALNTMQPTLEKP